MKKKLRKKRTALWKVKDADLLSTGSTLLNLACSGRPMGGFSKGRYFLLVGDSASGKTWLALSCLAEASINPAFGNYRFIYDNGEDGALMDIRHFFGKGVSKRLEPPAWAEVANEQNDEPLYSDTIEDFYYNIDDALQDGRPFIYILDSMDSLSSEAEIKKFDETKKAHRRGKETTGSYGDGKAKKNSSGIRQLLTPLRKSGSILLVLNQTRDNPAAGMFQSTKTRAGGHALRFYAAVEFWSSIGGHLKKEVRGVKREIGIKCFIRVKKNRFTGKLRQVEIPIYHSYGIDDIGSCVDYLTSKETKHWKKKKNTIKAHDFDLECSRKKLIEYIQEHKLEPDLQEIVGEVWDEIEKECALDRKRRYD